MIRAEIVGEAADLLRKIVQPGTPLHLRNESDADVLVFAYGAPREAPGRAELLQ